MTAPALKVVETLYETNAANIADMLRQAADNIATETEENSRTQAMVAVQIHEDGQIQIYGWGQTDSLRAMATLQLGLAQMTRDHLEANE